MCVEQDDVIVMGAGVMHVKVPILHTVNDYVPKEYAPRAGSLA